MGILIPEIQFCLFLPLCGMTDASDEVGNTWMSSAALKVSGAVKCCGGTTT